MGCLDRVGENSGLARQRRCSLRDARSITRTQRCRRSAERAARDLLTEKYARRCAVQRLLTNRYDGCDQRTKSNGLQDRPASATEYAKLVADAGAILERPARSPWLIWILHRSDGRQWSSFGAHWLAARWHVFVVRLRCRAEKTTCATRSFSKRTTTTPRPLRIAPYVPSWGPILRQSRT